MARKEQSTELTDRQREALALLLEGNTPADVAMRLGETEATISGWVTRDAVFVAEWNRCQQALWEANAQRLRRMADLALATLEGLLNSDNEGVRLRAATTILRAVDLTRAAEPKGDTDPELVKAVWAQRTLGEAGLLWASRRGTADEAGRQAKKAALAKPS